MAGMIFTQSQLVQWARSEYARMYRLSYEGVYNRLSTWMKMDQPSDRRVEFYGYYESAGDPERWDMGEAIPEEGLDSKTWSITNYKWGKRVRWPREDRDDDVTSSLMDAARGAGMKWARLPERLAFQLLLGAANPRLLPSIPTASDGGNLFATTVGGAARFGATDGNLLTGTGTTAAAIRTDTFSGIEQFKLFQDTKGEVLYDDSYEDAGYTIIHGAHLENEFTQAFDLSLVQGTSAAPSNVLLASKRKFERISTQRITGNSFYIVLNGCPNKPLVHQVREGIEERVAVADNSDSVRDFDVEYIQWRSRGSAGIGLPYGILQVSNV